MGLGSMWFLLSVAAASFFPDDIISDVKALDFVKSSQFDIKGFNDGNMEELMTKGWFGAAREIVVQSHDANVDYSSVVRRMAREIKTQADNLVRSLDPNYGKAQEVAPAFQWAQNDTAVFLNVKFTARWNAPGSLNVKDPSADIKDDSFVFTANGHHSGKLFKYVLNLDVFDRIDPAKSKWSTASVGKASVTLIKQKAAKWPRLLATKRKITNMHHWMDVQEKNDASLSGALKLEESALSCKVAKETFCIKKRHCVARGDCRKCGTETTYVEADEICAAIPSNRPSSVSFEDTNLSKGKISGVIKVLKPNNEYDITKYALYWGGSDQKPLDDAPFAELTPTDSSNEHVTYILPKDTELLPERTHILVYSVNSVGESQENNWTPLKDRVMPLSMPAAVAHVDTDTEKGHLSGSIKVTRAPKEDTVTHYGLYWGKTKKTRISDSAHIGNINVSSQKDPHEVVYALSNKTIPSGADYIIVCSRYDDDEMKKCRSTKIQDRYAPQGVPTVHMLQDENKAKGDVKIKLTIEPDLLSLDDVTEYKIYLGHQKKASKANAEAGELVGSVAHASGNAHFDLERNIGDHTHVYVFACNDVGQAKKGRSVYLDDEYEGKEDDLKDQEESSSGEKEKEHAEL